MLELLTVITIIGVLAALLFPAIKTAMVRAEVAKAQQGVNSLATAFKAYYNEYGKWPIADSMANNIYIVDTNMVMLLRGVNITTPPFSAPSGIGTATYQGNSRQTPFLEFKQTDIINTGTFAGSYVDPWGNPYYCSFDVTYVNQVQDPFLLPATSYLNAGFLIWSAGPDGQWNQSGDLGTGANKDNVKSW